MTLLAPWWLLAFVPAALAAWRAAGRRAPAATFAPLQLCTGDAALPRSWRVRLVWLPGALLLVAAALAAVALARPAHRVPLPAQHEGIDIVLCLDVSSSMAAADLDGRRSRLEVAKAAASRFVEGRPHDRIGVVRFARFADVVCPPTLDHLAVLEFLDGLHLVERDGDEDLTGIGGAVARTVQLLDSGALPSRVVVLVTDGEENVASAAAPEEVGPLQAAQVAAHYGVRVYTVAVGRGDLDTTQVEELAQRTGGAFHRADTAAAVEQIYAAIAELERAPFAAPRFYFEDRLAGVLIAAFAALLVALWLRAGPLAVSP